MAASVLLSPDRQINNSFIVFKSLSGYTWKCFSLPWKQENTYGCKPCSFSIRDCPQNITISCFFVWLKCKLFIVTQNLWVNGSVAVTAGRVAQSFKKMFKILKELRLWVCALSTDLHKEGSE